MFANAAKRTHLRQVTASRDPRSFPPASKPASPADVGAPILDGLGGGDAVALRPRELLGTALTPSARTLRVTMPARGLTAAEFEGLVGRHDFHAHLQGGGHVVFAFSASAFLPAGLGLWLLSFFNQLAAIEPGVVRLEFETPEGLFGYLDRSGFLQLLSPRVATTPDRPATSGADLFRGQANSLVEIAPLWPRSPVEEKVGIIAPLVRAICSHFPEGEETRRLGSTIHTLLGELVDNVFVHSETVLPGYVSLQAYRKRTGPRIQLSVSDSGIGIPESIRSTLRTKVGRLSDDEIILQAFRDGLSKHGVHAGRGCGLKRCASLAARYGAALEVRTPKTHIVLQPATALQPMHQAVVHHTTGTFTGTHLMLEFRVPEAGDSVIVG